MSELRQDPITRDWVIINPERAKRPEDAGGAQLAAPGDCPFCPGNEAAAPREVDSITDAQGRWLVRAVPNKYPALRSRPEIAPERGQSAEGWQRLAGYGHHEVIIESPDHAASLGTMPAEQVRWVIEMYVRRYRALAARDSGIRQVVLFRNQGRRAGTSLSHPHSQIVAAPVVSPETRRRMVDEVAFFDATGHCGLCWVLAQELQSGARVIHESECFATLAPYASRMPFQMQVVPLRHNPAFTEIDDGELEDLAAHLSRVLAGLHCLLEDPQYNLVMFDPPLDQMHRGANHWLIEIMPRITTPAGFELGSRIIVNVLAPEGAARELPAPLRACPK